MADHIVDTNVLCAASTIDPDSQFDGTDHVPLEQLARVFDWLMAFRGDNKRLLVLDTSMGLMKEYKGQLGDSRENNIGMRVIYEKWNTARLVDVPSDASGREKLSPALDQAHDYRGDRKLVALALADQPKSTIVNACDTDWYDWGATLTANGIVVEQIIGDWCRADWERKKKR